MREESGAKPPVNAVRSQTEVYALLFRLKSFKKVNEFLLNRLVELKFQKILPYRDQLNSEYGEQTASQVRGYLYASSSEAVKRRFRQLVVSHIITMVVIFIAGVAVIPLTRPDSALSYLLHLAAVVSITLIATLSNVSIYKFPPIRAYFHLPPDLEIFSNTWEIMTLAPGITRNIQTRRRIIGLLEKTAVTFESMMPTALGLDRGDPLDASVDHFRRVAEFIRNLKIWVAFPQETTRADLIHEQLAIIGPIATHRYHYLHAVEKVTATSARVRWQHHLMRAARQIFVAAIPIAVLLVTKAFGVSIPGEFRTYITLGCLLWAVIVLLSVLDPNYRDNVNTVKDLFESLKPGK